MSKEEAVNKELCCVLGKDTIITSNAVVGARVDEYVKEEASIVLAAMGLIGIANSRAFMIVYQYSS